MKINKVLRIVLITICSVIIGLPFLFIIFLFGILGYWNIMYPDPNCTNTNKIFDEYIPPSHEYKTELIRLLKKTEELDTDYWFGGYIDSEHISIFIQNDSLCVNGYITVNKDKLKNDGGFMNHLMTVKGVSYNGPLVGVKFEFSKEKENPEIFLTAVEDIID
jgi:hypothetical protein